MSDEGIPYVDVSLNTMAGCTGCAANCWALPMAWRHIHNPKQAARYAGLVEKRDGQLRWTGRVNVWPERLTIPFGWKRPRRIALNFMGDMFASAASFRDIDSVFAMMALCSQHTFLVLTKQPRRMAAYLADGNTTSRIENCGWALVNRPVEITWPLPNVWLGTSLSTQADADERIPHLLRSPAAVRWLSIEPLLEPVNLGDVTNGCMQYLPLHGKAVDCSEDDPRKAMVNHARVHWIVVGGESGPKARPMHPAWARSLRDQAKAAGAAFWFKQWGEWAPFRVTQPSPWPYGKGHFADWLEPSERFPNCRTGWSYCTIPGGGTVCARVGKEAAGRTLDGREWNEMPEVAHA